MTLYEAVTYLNDMVECKAIPEFYRSKIIPEIIDTLVNDTREVRKGRWLEVRGKCKCCSVCGIFVEDKYAGQWCSNCGNLLTNGENNE